MWTYPVYFSLQLLTCSLQHKRRGDAENLQERVLQAAPSWEERTSGQPRRALHGSPAAVRCTRWNEFDLMRLRTLAVLWQTRSQQTRHMSPHETIFIAPIRSRHMLRQHCSNRDKAYFTSCALKIHLFLTLASRDLNCKLLWNPHSVISLLFGWSS